MPRRPQPQSLREASLKSIVSNIDDYWDYWCAGITSALLDDSGQSDVFTPFQYLSDDMIQEIIDMLQKTDYPQHLYLKLLLHSNIRRLELKVYTSHYSRISVLKTLGNRCQKLTCLRIINQRDFLTTPWHNHFCMLFANMSLLTSLTVGIGFGAEVLKVVCENCPNLIDLFGYSRGSHYTGLLYLCNSPTHPDTLPKLNNLSILGIQGKIPLDTIVQLLKSHPRLLKLIISNHIDHAFEQMYGEEFQSLKKAPSEWIHNLLELTIDGRSKRKSKLSEVDRLNLTFQCCPFLIKLRLIHLVDRESLNTVSKLKHLTKLDVSVPVHPFDWASYEEKFSTYMFPILTYIGQNLVSLRCKGFDEVSLITIGKLCPKLESLQLKHCEFVPEHDLMADYRISSFPCFTNLNVIQISRADRCSGHLDTFVDEEALSLLLQNATGVTDILLYYVTNLTDETICSSHKKHRFRHLKKFRLFMCSPVSVKSIWTLLSADNLLEDLEVSRCGNITDDDMNNVKDEAEERQFIINIRIDHHLKFT